MPQDLQLGAGAKQVDAWRRRDLTVVSIDEVRIRLEAIEQHLQLVLHDVPAGRPQNTVPGRHQEAIAEVGPATRKAVNGQLPWQRETCCGIGLEPLRGLLQDLYAKGCNLLELNPLPVSILPVVGLQLRKGDKAPGQIIAVEGMRIEAKERLRPLAEVLQLKDATVAREHLRRGDARL